MTLVPSRRFVLLMLLPLAFGLAALGERALIWPMLALDGVIALFALVDAILARAPLVEVTRVVREVLSIRRANQVTLELRSRARRPLRTRVTDDIELPADAPMLPLKVVLPPRGRKIVHYLVFPNRRGAYALGDHHVRYPSPFGLWWRQQRIEARSPVRVYPDVQQVRNFELMARQNREGAMTRASRKVGGRNEFEALREYQRDDEFRSIDWKATARRHKLISRQYQMERDQSVVFVLDAGRLMTAKTGGLPLFDHALNAALMLGTVAARGGDNVGLLAFADEILRYIPPKASRRGVRELIQATFDVHAQLVESDYDLAFGQLAPRLRKRSLVVIFTSVLDEDAARDLLRYTRGLMPRHLPLLVLLRDPELEGLAIGVDDEAHTGRASVYTSAAAAEILRHRDSLARSLRQAGALVLEVASEQLTPALINRYLEVKGRHLL